MPFTSTQKKEAYRKLHDEVKDFVIDNETTELIGNFLVVAGLSEEERDLADTEIFNAMLELQDLESAIKNISEITKKDSSEFENLKANLQEKIFNEILRIKRENDYKQNPETKDNPEVKNSPSRIGDSFEQIILNQAIAMQPAVESTKTGRDTSYETRNNTEGKVPENLPIEEKREENVSQNIHNYESGKDPYREPLE